MLNTFMRRLLTSYAVVLILCAELAVPMAVSLSTGVHEVPNKPGFFDEIARILTPNGQILLVEPPFHLSKNAFEETTKITRDAGFSDTAGPHMIFHKTAVLKKG